jgi:hypothetical protein
MQTLKNVFLLIYLRSRGDECFDHRIFHVRLAWQLRITRFWLQLPVDSSRVAVMAWCSISGIWCCGLAGIFRWVRLGTVG